MTIKNDGGEKVCTCDGEGCTEFEYSGVLSFAEFVSCLKNNGWKIVKDGDNWLHYCIDCPADAT